MAWSMSEKGRTSSIVGDLGAWSINLGIVNGKRRRLTGSLDEWGENFQTEASARGALDRKLHMLAGAEDPDRLADAAKLSIEEYLAQWIKTRRTSGLRASTIAANQGHIERYIVPEIGRIRLRRLSRTAVKAWVARLQLDHGSCPWDSPKRPQNALQGPQ